MKKGRASNVEIFYVLNNEKSVEDLAKDLDRSTNFVEKILKDKPKASTTTVKPPQEGVTTIKKTTVGDLMGKTERNGQVTSTVMTEAASGRADGSTKKNKVFGNSPRLKDSLYKPLG